MFGKHANTNGLISFEEHTQYTLQETTYKKYDLPKNIYYYNNRGTYFACVIYKKVRYCSETYHSLAKAELKLQEIYMEIENVKKQEKEDYLKTPILQ